jgi:hypothetical protein
MATLCCHPKAPHRKLRVPEWYVSSLMIERALDAIVRRVKVLDRVHDIPYLAGYSLDGKTIYIDRHLPRSFTYKGREIEVDRYLILHEEVEKTLIDQLGLHYLHAHQIATRAEEAAVRAEKISWRDYDRFMQKYVKEADSELLTEVPADLDLKPYRDEHDYELLTRMAKAIEGGNQPDGIDKKKLGRALDKKLAKLRARVDTVAPKGKSAKAAKPAPAKPTAAKPKAPP